MAYPQPKSDSGMSIVNATENKRKVISPCTNFSFNQSVTCETMKPHSIIEPVYNTIRNASIAAAQQGSYLANHCFHPVRYNHFGLFAPLRTEQAAALPPGHARGFSHRTKAPNMMPERNRNIRDHKRRLLVVKYELR